nr:cytosolic phospholipase A2 isoform X1 [Ciona intestinalis]|eukprot:XP_026692097.1 cytosolic phospholipase A2 isoform X1 [Ciona intestinalis]
MLYNEFVLEEDERQTRYHNVKVPFEPVTVLSVTLLRCRDISMSSFSDFFDTPDVKFNVRCKTLPSPNLFCSRGREDTTTYDINETFKFIIPNDLDVTAGIPIEISAIDIDIVFDDLIAKRTIDAAPYETNGKENLLTVSFGSVRENHGEVDISLTKTLRTSPDFRLGHELHNGERIFRKKRFPKVFKALNKILGEDGPKNLLETPVVALASSGGGYRAAVGLCGAMEAFKDIGVLDTFMYTAGVSGSAWYFTTAYQQHRMTPKEITQFVKSLKQNVIQKWVSVALQVVLREGYFNFVEEKQQYGQPTSFVDFFGYLIGTSLLGKEDRWKKLSTIQSYLTSADVPFPLIEMLHVKNRALASTFHVYIECSPYEYNLPVFGYGIPVDQFGSVFNGGFLARRCPELPLHFLQGTVGSAFSVIFNAFATGETSLEFNKYIDHLRVKGKSKSKTGTTNGTNKNKEKLEIESDSEIDSDDEEENDRDPVTSQGNGDQENGENSEREKSFLSTILASLKDTELFQSRVSFLGRTAKYFNFSRGFKDITTYYMNPLGEPAYQGPEQKQLAARLGIRERKKMSTKRDIISVVDAGVLNNVPTDVILRPQRAVDVLIVTDFTASPSDEKLDFTQILIAAVQAWQNGMKFPPISFDKIANLPPQEYIVLEDENDDECPIVVWITLCNKKFQNLKNFKPRYSTEDVPEGQKFNDFNVFTKETAFSTFDFDYTGLEFDQLVELMYYNVTSCSDTIQAAIKRAIKKKRRKRANQSDIDVVADQQAYGTYV